MDTNLLREAVQAVKFEDVESLYSEVYGGTY